MKSTSRKLQEVIEYIRVNVDEEIPIRQLALIFQVVNNEGETQHKLAPQLGMSEGTISKHLKMLSVYGERNKEGNMQLKGHGLLEVRPDIYDRKRNAVFTTEKGKKLVKALSAILEGE